MRIGHGFDVHAFGRGDHVMLGGVRIPATHGVVAHSDGDVVLHAVCDALLGAAALGDIGRHFPDSDPQWAGVASSRFVNHVTALLAERGLRPGNVDVTVLAQSPRLAPHIGDMRASLAGLLRLAEDRVSIKATTTERLGFIGREEGLAAEAVVLVLERSEAPV
ncbi:MAG: 2-C-methyl-D-erythritol 2,4-cyclodiphosphate synthase [Gammaproteobacteria bacterium]|jgi:2-C-methyl-D-erythritol 2,4-cyclodiphosphate synthase